MKNMCPDCGKHFALWDKPCPNKTMTTFKDRLDGILDIYDNETLTSKRLNQTMTKKVRAKADQEIIDLFLEIVGSDETILEDTLATDLKHSRNELRAELRNKLKGDN